MQIDYVVLAVSAIAGIGGGLWALYVNRDRVPRKSQRK